MACPELGGLKVGITKPGQKLLVAAKETLQPGL